MANELDILRLNPVNVQPLRRLIALFGDAYLEGLLAKEPVVALVAMAGEEVTGCLVTY